MKRSLFFCFFCFALFSFGLSQNYSIKNRLNTKLSLSFNRTNEVNEPLFRSDNIPIHPFQARHNLRADCNYGVLNWLELGGYIGYIRYKNGTYINKRFMKGYSGLPPIAFAPTLGVNVNVHLLPVFDVKKDCRWELYLTAKYGGAYLINHVAFYTDAIIIDKNVNYIDFYCNAKRYRHEFGIGMGGGVYFWKVFGLYAEALVGQYSYFPELFTCYYTVRGGIEFKFTPNKKAKK